MTTKIEKTPICPFRYCLFFFFNFLRPTLSLGITEGNLQDSFLDLKPPGFFRSISYEATVFFPALSLVMPLTLSLLWVTLAPDVDRLLDASDSHAQLCCSGYTYRLQHKEMLFDCMWKKAIIDIFLKAGLNGEALRSASCLQGEKRRPRGAWKMLPEKAGKRWTTI